MNANTISSFLFQLCDNPWKGTPFEDIYGMNPRKRGTIYEDIVSYLLEQQGYDVQKRTNTGHDRIINGVKAEIKMGLTTKRNYNYQTIFNHIGFEKDWEDIYFCCVNGDLNIRLVKISKNDLLKLDFYKHQQGGKSSNNDDFMIDSTQAYNLLFCDQVDVILE